MKASPCIKERCTAKRKMYSKKKNKLQLMIRSKLPIPMDCRHVLASALEDSSIEWVFKARKYSQNFGQFVVFIAKFHSANFK